MDREALRALAARLNSEWNLNAPPDDDVIVLFDDPRDSVVEHMCHELAHAALLGLEFGPFLARRITAELDRRTHQADEGIELAERNEVETFAVESRVLTALEVDHDPDVLLDACMVQVTHYDRAGVREAWAAFWQTKTCADAAATILRTLMHLHQS